MYFKILNLETQLALKNTTIVNLKAKVQSLEKVNNSETNSKQFGNN